MALIESFSTSTGVNFNLIADCYLDEQNTSTNKSKVTVKLYLEHNKISATALSGSYLSVAGNKVSYDGTKITQPDYGITKKLLATKTVTISHSSDGKGSCNVKGVFVLNGTYGGKYITTLTLNETLTLPTIPRSSTFSMASSINTGSSLKITITPSSSSFKHKVRFEIDGISKYTSDWIAAGTTSKSFDIPHSWVTDDVSKTMTVYCYTYTSSATSGSDYIARITKTVTLNVPDSVIPTISAFEPTIVNGLSGKYVEGKSQIKLSITAAGNSGSTIKSYVYSGPNINGSKSSYTGTSSSKTSSIIQQSGKISYSVYVKDSRGRKSAKKTITINVEPYFEPTITSLTVQRCTSDGTISSSGTYAYVTVTSNYAKVDGANKRTVVLTNSSDNYATTKTIQSTSNTKNTYSGVYGSSFALGTEYTIKAKITDTAYSNTHELSAKLATAERPLNIAKYGNGVAIGGMSTVTSSTAAGKFECNWQSVFKEGVNIDNTSQEYLTVTRRDSSDDINQDGTNETADIRVQLYINDGGNITCRRRYKTSDMTDFTTQGYWQLRDSDFYTNTYICTPKEIFTNSKTDAYDGKQGVCISNNGRVYLVGTTEGKTGAISPYKPGVIFAYDNSTKGTSSIIETASGELTLNCNTVTTGNVATEGKFGSTSAYGDLVFATYCKWKDNSNHDIINRDTDGLTAGVGWAGSSTYSTVLNLRGRTVKAPNNSGVAVTSDERLKNSFEDLDKYESFFEKLNPIAFKYNDGDSGRYHIGFGAQSVERALSESGLDNTHFGGILRYPISDKSEEYHGYDEEYGLIYNEFIALNTHMIQKLQKIVQDQQNEIEALKAEINDMKNK